MNEKLDFIISKIKQANNILLTTHLECDGDGLGAIIGLYHALKPLNKQLTVMTVDAVPKKYSFLDTESIVQIHEDLKQPLENYDLCLVFDTNDQRLIEPMYTELIENNTEVFYIDHHPVLNHGPLPTEGSLIDLTAASTGELAYRILNKMGLSLNEASATALYTSVCFDTQLFRYVKSIPESHLVTAELLKYIKHPEDVHKYLFSTYTVGKTKFLSEVLGSIEFLHNDQVACILVKQSQLIQHGLNADDARDVIDMIMNINSLEAAVLFREEDNHNYKISLRSKGKIKVLPIAEDFDGGGHPFAAGALLNGDYETLRNKVVTSLIQRLVKASA